MKKLRFELSPNLGEVLTRNELKYVFGGSGSGSGNETDGPCEKTAGCPPPGYSVVSCSGVKDCGYIIERVSDTRSLVVGVYCQQKSGNLLEVRCPGY